MNDINWVRVFKSSVEAELALVLLEPRPLKYKDERLCLVRTRKKIVAFFDECPHKRVPLSKGYCTKEERIICTLHSYIYDLSSGEEVEGKGKNLKFYPVKETEEGIFIGFPMVNKE